MKEAPGFLKRIFRRRSVLQRREKLHELDVKLRSEGSRREQMRGLMTLLAVLCSLAVVFVGLRHGINWVVRQMMHENPSFAIDQIEIEGIHMLGRDVVRNWAGVSEGQNLFNVDVSRVKRDLELVPFIESASVERVLPRKLKISIVERSPVARVCIYRPSTRNGGVQTANLFLDSQGYVMPASGPFSEVAGATNQAALVKLPVITGIQSDQLRSGTRVESPQTLAALRLIADFRTSALSRRLAIQSLDVLQKRTLLLTTSDGAETTLALQQFPQQLARWQAVLEWAAKLQRIPATIDLAAGIRLPVRWREVPAESQNDSNSKPTTTKHV